MHLIRQDSVTTPVARPPRLGDSLFLVIVVLLSATPYLTSLGFYSDDWYFFLARFHSANEQSVWGFLRAAYALQIQWMRPVQILYIAMMYDSFGLNPLGYHIVNIVMIALASVGFYHCLTELQMPRPLALATPLIYSLLPHYSASRFWVSASQANLHMALMFLSSYSLMRACRRESGAYAWLALSCLAMWLSILAYEVAVPLFIVAPLLVLYRLRSKGKKSLRLVLVMCALYFLSFGFLVALKGVSSSRLAVVDAEGQQIVSFGIRRLFHLGLPADAYGLNIERAIAVNFGTLGLEMPRIAWKSVNMTGGLLAGSALFLVVVTLYLFATLAIHDWPSVFFWWSSVAAGLVMFATGYSIFLVTSDIQFTAAGIGNRIAIAATVGVALIFTGCTGLLTSSIRSERGRRLIFSVVVGLMSTASFAIVSRVAIDWAKAWPLQLAVLHDIRERLPKLPAGSSLILDGVCPYIGPAIVFENSDDLTGALQILYRDPKLKADVVTPRLKFGPLGVTTTTYDSVAHYPYGTDLLLFNRKENFVISLVDFATTQRYFERWNPTGDGGCPPAHEGLGVRIF